MSIGHGTRVTRRLALGLVSAIAPPAPRLRSRPFASVPDRAVLYPLALPTVDLESASRAVPVARGRWHICLRFVSTE